jgi:hypothetical protein
MKSNFNYRTADAQHRARSRAAVRQRNRESLSSPSEGGAPRRHAPAAPTLNPKPETLNSHPAPVARPPQL